MNAECSRFQWVFKYPLKKLSLRWMSWIRTRAETSDDTKGFFASIKNFSLPAPEDFAMQLEQMGVAASEHSTEKKALENGQLVIVAHHPPTVKKL